METERDLPGIEFVDGTTKLGILEIIGNVRAQLGKRGLRELLIDCAFVVTAALIVAIIMKSMNPWQDRPGTMADQSMIEPVLMPPILMLPLGLIAQAICYAGLAIFGSDRKQGAIGMLFTIGLLALGYFAGFLTP